MMFSFFPRAPFARSLAGLFVCFLVCSPVSLLALDPEKTVFQFNCQNWTRLTGLPADRIGAVTQSADGYIWLGGQNGLIRFDGTQFKSVSVALPEAQGQDVRNLRATPDGKLWFSIASGGFGQYDGQSFSPIGDPHWATTDGANSTTIFIASDGAIWTGSVFGWRRWVKDRPDLTAGDQDFGSALSFWEEPSGRVWIGSTDHGLSYWENGALHAFPDKEMIGLHVWSIARDRAGHLWVGTHVGLRHYDADNRLVEVILIGQHINALHLDPHGVLWIATAGSGVGRYQNGQLTLFGRKDGLVSDRVTSLFEDAEGSLWVGTVEGLSQLSDLKFPILSASEGLTAGPSHVMTPSRRGGLWIGGARGFSYLEQGNVVNYVDPVLTPNLWVRRIFEARDGRVFVGDGNRNVNVISDGRLLFRFTPDLWPEAIAEDSKSVLLGVGPGLHRLIGTRLVPYEFEGETPNLDWVNQIFVARDDILWVATNMGLFRIEDGRARRWSIDDGLLSNRVHYIAEDAEGTLWFGFPSGLMRLKDGKFTAFTAETGLSDERIYAIVPDDLGALWLMSGRGILRAALESLNAFADGRASRIDCTAYDGLESVKFTDRTEQAFSGAKTHDGRIWFPNPRGVVMVDPAKHFSNHVPPRVHLDRILIDGEPRTPAQAATLDSGDRRVEFFFNALSYIAPKKVRIQYRLEGFDSGWIDADQQRSATYNNLDSGRYTFHIRAANADGVWNVGDTKFAFVLPPTFYETLWFYALCGLAVGGSIWGGVRWKVQHLRRVQQKLLKENDLLEAKVSERTDELAQSFSILKATLDSTADGILAIQSSGAVATYNAQFTSMWRIPPESMRDDKTVRAIAAEQVKNPEAFLARLAEIHANPDQEAFDVIEMKDGRVFERYCKPQRLDDRIAGIVINFRDITERRRAEEALRASESFLNSLVENLPVNIFRKDREGRITFANRRYCERYGRPLEEIIGRTSFDLMSAEDAERLQKVDLEILATGRPFEGTDEQTMPSGERRFIQIIKVPVLDAAGACIGIQGMFLDVTEAKLAEQRLAEASSLLEAMLENTPDAIYFKDRDSRFVRVSKALLARFPNPEQMRNLTDFDLYSEEHARKAFNDEQEIIRTGVPILNILEKETYDDGRITWALTTKMPWRDPSGTIIGTFGLSKDITPLKDAEARLAEVHRQLLDTSRQAGMAEVATGVLHNVGNVLNSVNVSATLIADQVRESKTANLSKVAAMLQEHTADLGQFLTEDPKGRRIPGYLSTLAGDLSTEQKHIVDELGHLRKNIEHIKDIVAMQQSYAKVSGVVEAVPLVELAEDALRINASALVRHGLELVRDYQAQPVVSVERHKVLQILVNLIRNSKHACDESGRSDKCITVRITQEAERVRICVIDNGVGIPRENLTRIFAHGFTTKKEGHGFGLHSGALAAKEMGGSLHADSAGAGLGATFSLELPLSPESRSA